MERTLKISEETYQRIKEQLTDQEKVDINSYEDMIGKSFFFRTVTYHTVGKVVGFVGSLVKLENASWVADSGRYSNAIENGDLQEVEYIGDRLLNMNSVVDVDYWNHKLPTETK